MKTKLNLSTLAAVAASLWLLAAATLTAADMTRLDPRSGSKMRIEGTSLAHDWQAESPLILGFLEVGSNFPTEPGQAVTPGKVEARGQASVAVRSLYSKKADGSFYDDKMDTKMREMLKEQTCTNIVYRLDELVLKEAPKDKNGPYLFDSTGELTVACVSKKISMPISVLPLPNKTVKITGSAPLKMTDFKIEPAHILFVKTADEVTVKFVWMVGQKKAAAAASK